MKIMFWNTNGNGVNKYIAELIKEYDITPFERGNVDDVFENLRK